MTPQEFAEACRSCQSPQMAMELLKSAADIVAENERLTSIAYRMKEKLEKYIAAYKQQQETISQYEEETGRLRGRISDLEDQLEEKRIELAQMGGLDLLIERFKGTAERSEAVAERLEAVQVKADKPAAKKQSTKSKTQKEPSKKYGEYKHVKLTDTQYKNLVSKYGTKIIDEYIRKVDEYCQRDGKTYNDYSLAIQNFMRRDNIQPEANAGNEHSYDLNKLLKHAQDNVPTIKED